MPDNRKAKWLLWFAAAIFAAALLLLSWMGQGHGRGVVLSGAVTTENARLMSPQPGCADGQQASRGARRRYSWQVAAGKCRGRGTAARKVSASAFSDRIVSIAFFVLQFYPRGAETFWGIGRRTVAERILYPPGGRERKTDVFL